MIGRTLAHYQILRELGSGGMGTVYLAEDTRLGRQVALKVLPDELGGDPARLERFKREARTVAGFNHPSIVTLHSVEEAEGVHFLTMEHIQGKTLDRLIPEGGMALPSLFDLAIPLADALAAAHTGGITHRDLKPANVMVTDDGRVKILDFGLAKPAEMAVGPDEATLVASEALTQQGMLVGTVPYMSPEQIEGKPLDSRSDIFSLGVLLYQMATGSHPFSGDSSTSLLAAILKDEPRPPLEKRADVPRQLARIIQHSLEKNPQRRFQSALDVRNELEALRKEESGQLGGPPLAAVIPKAELSSSPMPKALWTSGLAVVLVAALVGLWVLRGSRTPSEPASGGDGGAGMKMVAVLPFENLGAAEDEYFAAGIAEEITSRLASASGLGVISRNSARRYAETDKTIDEIGRELGVAYVLEGTVRWASQSDLSRVRITPQLIRVSDDLQLWSNTYDHVLEDIFEVQSEIAGQVIEQLGVTLLARERKAVDARPTENIEAYQAYLRGQDTTGRQEYSKEDRLLEVQMFERAVELDPDFAQAWAALSTAHAKLIILGFDKSEERLAASKAAVDRALELQPSGSEAHLALAYYHYWGERDYESALAALAVAEKGLPNNLEILLGKAWIARRQGRWDEAIRLANEGSRLDPLASNLPRELAVMYLHVRDHQRTLQSLERSIALAPDEQAAYILRGLAYWTQGDLAASRAALDEVPGEATAFVSWALLSQASYERDWAAAEAVIGNLPEGPLVIVPEVMLSSALLMADVEWHRGNGERARELWQVAKAQFEAVLEETPDDARAHAALGRALAGLGEKEAALAAGHRAVELYPVSKDALHGPRQHFELAIIAGWLGETAAALEQLEIVLSDETVWTPAFIRIDPSFDPIREDPAFEALLARYQ